MKKTELYALSSLLLAILLASFNINVMTYIMYLAHLSYIIVILIMLTKSIDFHSILTFFYKMFLSTAVIFKVQDLPLASELFITGFGLAILSFCMILFKSKERKLLLSPILFINFSSFLIYIYN